MDKLKYIKFEQDHNIPIAVDGKNVDLKIGHNLEEVLKDYDLTKGTIEERLNLLQSEIENIINAANN